MWVFIPGGFVSIVAHRDKPGTVLVRARRRADLPRFFAAGGTKVKVAVQETPDADYPFRVEASRSRVSNLVMLHALAIDYDNFKGAPANKDRAHALHAVWAAARELED